MIKTIYIPNILELDGRVSKVFEYNRNLSVAEYIAKSGLDLKDNKVILSGKKLDDLTVKPKKGEEIIVTPDVRFTAIAAALVWFGGGSLIWGAIKAVAIIATIAYGIYSMVSQPRKPTMDTFSPYSPGGIDESSPTYGWDGVQTTQEVGIPVPIVYGEHKVGGNVINNYIRYDGDNSYLNVLLGLCEGEIEAISDIKINDNPIANFDDVETVTKLGTNDQLAIDKFEDAHNMYSVGVDLTKNNSYVYTTADDDVEAIEIHLSCPGGLFATTGGGGMTSSSVTYKVEYKLHSDPAYTNLGETTFSASTRSAVRRVFRIDDLVPGEYDIRVTKTSDDSTVTAQRDLRWTQVDEIKKDNLSYPNTVLLAIEAMATNQISGSMPNFTCIVKGKKVAAPVVLNGVTPVDWEDYYWDPTEEAFRLLSDDTILTWDGTSFADQYCANPIWCMRDLLINNRYGLGEFIDTDILNSSQLVSMSKYCEEKLDDGEGGYEKRFRLDVVIDGGGKALDVISQLATVFRGLPFYSAGNINLRIDRPSTPVQVFGMGNIIKNSFNESWASVKEKPNVIEVQYLNKDKDYKQEIVAYIDEVAVAAGDPIRKKTVKLFTTRTSQAMREARYALKVAKYIDKTVNFKAGVDAIACQAGDLVSISHDVLGTGSSGNVLAESTTTSINLDQPVVLLPGETYKIRIRFADDTIEEKTISSAAGTHETVAVAGDPFTSAPAAFDKYMIGTATTVKEDFRIISMSKDSRFEVEITAIKYDEDVYDDTAITLPDDNTSVPSYEIPAVSDLQLIERIYTRDDGTVDSAIDVYFLPPDLTDYSSSNRYKGANVYVRESSDAPWRFVAYTESDYVQITGNLVVGETYYVCVTSVSFAGFETARGTAPNDDITLAGKTASPNDINNFAYDFTDEIVLTWDKVPNTDVAGYEIRLADNSWGTDNADLVYRGQTNSHIYRPDSRSPGTHYIRAYNTTGIYSETSASVTPTNAAPGAPTGFESLVFFNIAKLTWDNVADADLKKYELYRSETDEWTGEEVLEKQVSGRSALVEARTPNGGTVGTTIPANPDWIFSSDLENDGTLGQIFAYKNSNGILYLKNGIITQLIDEEILAIDVGDADTDGVDEIIASYGGKLYAYKGGTWTEKNANSPVNICIGKNVDGTNNAVVCNFNPAVGGNRCHITFDYFSTLVDINGYDTMASIVAGDFNADGRDAFLCYYSEIGTGALWRYDYNDATKWIRWHSGPGPQYISKAIGDFEGSGRDCVLVSWDNFGIYRVRQNSATSSATFTQMADDPVKMKHGFFADFGDGLKAYGYLGDDKLYVYSGSGFVWTELDDTKVPVAISKVFTESAEEKILISTDDGLYKLSGETTYSLVRGYPDNSISDANLIGEDDDFCIGDIIEITSGDNIGDKKTITAFDGDTGTVFIDGTWTINPLEGDKFIIYDKSYFKVRGVDSYGVGTFSSSLAVEFQTLTEDALGDNIITARKITTGELITLSAQIKDAIITSAKILSLSADKITAGTIGAEEIVISEGGSIQSEDYEYEVSGWKIDGTSGLEVWSGAIQGNTIVLGTVDRGQLTLDANSRLGAVRHFIDGVILEYIDADTVKVGAGVVCIDRHPTVAPIYHILENSSAITLDLDEAGHFLTGSRAANTWYYVYVCPDDDEENFEAYFSTNAPDYYDSSESTDGPARYIYNVDKWYRCVGSIRTDASQNIREFKQYSKKILWKTYDTLFTNDYTSTSWSVDISAYAPAIADHGIFSYAGSVGDSSNAQNMTVGPDDILLCRTGSGFWTDSSGVVEAPIPGQVAYFKNGGDHRNLSAWFSGYYINGLR